METRVATLEIPSARIDRAALRSALEEHRDAFLALVDAIPDERWNEKSPTCAWTIGEVLVHLTWAVEQLPQEVVSARRGKGMFNYPSVVAAPLSYWYTRWMARNASRESIRNRYRAAISAALIALDDVPDSDWTKGARFYGERFYSVADLFKTPSQHFASHTNLIETEQPQDKR